MRTIHGVVLPLLAMLSALGCAQKQIAESKNTVQSGDTVILHKVMENGLELVLVREAPRNLREFSPFWRAYPVPEARESMLVPVRVELHPAIGAMLPAGVLMFWPESGSVELLDASVSMINGFFVFSVGPDIVVTSFDFNHDGSDGPASRSQKLDRRWWIPFGQLPMRPADVVSAKISRMDGQGALVQIVSSRRNANVPDIIRTTNYSQQQPYGSFVCDRRNENDENDHETVAYHDFDAAWTMVRKRLDDRSELVLTREPQRKIGDLPQDQRSELANSGASAILPVRVEIQQLREPARVLAALEFVRTNGDVDVLDTLALKDRIVAAFSCDGTIAIAQILFDGSCKMTVLKDSDWNRSSVANPFDRTGVVVTLGEKAGLIEADVADIRQAQYYPEEAKIDHFVQTGKDDWNFKKTGTVPSQRSRLH